MKTILLLGTALSLSGCAALIGKQSEQVDQIVSFDGAANRTFTFKKAYPEHNIDESIMVKAVMESMKKASTLKLHHEFSKKNTYKRGVEISALVDGAGEKHFSVIHHNNFKSLNGRKVGRYPFNIKETNSEYIITMICPNEFHNHENFKREVNTNLEEGFIDVEEVIRNFLNKEEDQALNELRKEIMNNESYISDKDAIINFNHICKSTKSPTIRFYETNKGEYNSKYSPDSIQANFERLANKQLENGSYRFNILNNQYDVFPKIVPYRNGSKITYVINGLHKADSSTNTYSKEQVEVVHNKIKSVIND